MTSSFLSCPWPSPSNLRRSPPPPSIIASTSAIYLGRRLHDVCAAQVRRLLSPERSYFESGDVWRRIELDWFRKVPKRDAAFLCGGFLFGGEERVGKADGGKFGRSNSGGVVFDGRMWTNVLLALNVLTYAGQVATQGKLLLWGAKVNSLIDKGQLWRLVTSAFMHANVGHLMVNCFSLNSIGPTVEKVSGPGRFIAIYFCSAIASSLMSYRFASSPSVGASGAIFGLVGSFAVFLLRHKNFVGGGKKELLHVANVIALNLAFGFVYKGIDNWGHLGGLLGGAAMSWFLGPAWKYEGRMLDGRLVFADRAPIFRLINKRASS